MPISWSYTRSGVMRIRCRLRRCWRMISCAAANGIRCVNPSSAMACPSCTCVAIASARGTDFTQLSLDDGLRLLAQVLRQVIEGSDRLPRAARALPAAERLVPGPRTGGCPLRSVRIGHAGLDVLLEPGDLIAPAVEARGEPER